MNEIRRIIATPKTGSESLTDEGQPIGHTLLGFWRWSVSDILSNATRGIFAEFIVATAIGTDPNDIRDEWGAYDLVTRKEGIKIEVKSAAYIQSWQQKDFSTISFSIKPARFWDPDTNIMQKESRRHADIYIFCHLKHKDPDTIDPLKMEQWDFYVVPTHRLNNYRRSQISITLNSLQKIAIPVQYRELYDAICKAMNEQEQA